MKISLRTFSLFFVIIMEGYVVLSSELLAIRQTIPFVGNGTDTISIIIAAVLMPLAFGYAAGGRFKPGFRQGRYRSIRKKLVLNMIIAQGLLLIGLSYIPLTLFFETLGNTGLNHRLILTTIYASLFLVIPVYLLGQTIPLISNYFSKEKLAKVTGRILFFSTLGSFFGAVFSTLVLMATIGVHHTSSLIFIILTGLIFLLSKQKFSEITIYSVGILALALFFNSDTLLKRFNIVEDNQYNTIMVYEDAKKDRNLIINRNYSSRFNDQGRKHDYIEFIEKMTIEPIKQANPPKNILVIGAGAFTFGFHDKVNNYDYVDIDGSLLEIAEKYILKQKLSKNKTFHAVPARAFLKSTKKIYDVIFLDAYFGDTTIPEHLVTQEFFKQVKNRLSDNGVLATNLIASPNFSDRFSRHIDNTLRSVFPHLSRHIIYDNYLLWNDNPNQLSNIIYLHRAYPEADTEYIYTDNLNRIFLDKPQRR